MTSEVAKVEQKAAYVARYDTKPADRFAAFANEGGPGIKGKLLTCSKGDWSVGADKDTGGERHRSSSSSCQTRCEAGSALARRCRHRRRHGSTWATTSNSSTAPLLATTRGRWEKTDDTPRDPWMRTYRALLIEMTAPHGDITYTGSSCGAQIALKEICRDLLGRHAPLPGRLPCSRAHHEDERSTRATARSRAPGSTSSAGRLSRTSRPGRNPQEGQGADQD